MSKVSLARQIAELQRERRKRDDVFPRLVTRREMKQEEADYLNESLDAAIATLEWVERNAEVIRRVHAELKAPPAEEGTP